MFKKLIVTSFALCLLIASFACSTSNAGAALIQTATVGKITFFYPEGWTLIQNEKGVATVVRTVIHLPQNKGGGIDGYESMTKDASFTIYDFSEDDSENGGNLHAAILLVYGGEVFQDHFKNADDVVKNPYNGYKTALRVFDFKISRLMNGDHLLQYSTEADKHGYIRDTEYYVYDDSRIKYPVRYMVFGLLGNHPKLPENENKALDDIYEAVVRSATYTK